MSFFVGFSIGIMVACIIAILLLLWVDHENKIYQRNRRKLKSSKKRL